MDRSKLGFSHFLHLLPPYPMQRFRDAFISYGRRDSKAFTGWLCDRLTAAGLDAWYDQNDIPLGVDYQNQIDDGIAQSHNFLFIISPHSVHSAYCRKEIELAVKLRKRIIPLLHVGEISRDTWQERNPNGTDEEWAVYQQKGLHSSFVPDMYPVIEKINWVYIQEGVDDYEKGLVGLLDIFERQKSYVHQHTWLLHEAMHWERQHRSASCLLIGEERKAAEDWLRVRFDTEQPPCEPTDLHCEFIGESIKNANNLMTRVFLCAAPEDGAIADHIRKSLLRESITVWTNQADINSGENQELAINRGIEGADQMIYLVSPESTIAPACQRELTYALSLNKRVIPIQVATFNPDLPTDSETIWQHTLPESLRGVQHIDVTDADDPIRYQRAIAQLVQELSEEATYYEQHKILLVKALKWQAQNQNPSILLRGYNLDYARAWLATAERRSHHGPIPLMQTFITESQKLPPNRTLEVFISYSRTDSDFARKLNDALQTQGKTTWFDQESIASGTDFQREIYRGIECAENFVFILSPSSVRSPYCADEANYARDRNKRIITILHRPVDSSEMPEALSNVQWIDFTTHQGDFYTHFNELVRTLETDRDYIHQHAQWWLRARDWEQQEQSKDLLLRGSEFAIADAWLQKAAIEHKQPPVTELHRRYLQESERAIAAAHRQEQIRQWILRGMLAGMSVAFLLVFRFWRQAQSIQEGQINAVSRYSQILLTNNQQIPALVESIRGARLLQRHRTTPETQNNVLNALRNVMVQANESNSLQAHDFGINWVAYSSDGGAIATASADHTAILWTPDGQQLAILKGHQGEVTSIRFSRDGETIATSGQDDTVKLWNRQGNLLQTLTMPLNGRNEFQDVAFSPDGSQVAATGQDGNVYLWQEGKLLKTFEAHTRPVNGIGFSPNGRFLATASDDRTIKLWTPDGKLIQTFKGHEDRVLDIAFSPDGNTLASAGADNTARLWKLDGTPLVSLRGHRGWVWSVNFSPDGQRIVTASDDKTLKVWNREGQELNTLRGHEQAVVAGTFSPDGTSLISGSYDGMLKLWRSPELQITTLTDFSQTPKRVQFSRDSQTVLTSTSGGQVALWSRQGKQLSEFEVGQAIAQATLHPNGQIIATANDDGSVQFWTPDGTLIRTFKGHTQKVVSVRFSPDGTRIATASEDGTACIWSVDGKLLSTLRGHTSRLTDVVFSPDGEALATASYDNTVRLWDTQGNVLHTLAHPVVPSSISFSPNGETLAAATELGRVLLWNRRGELLMTFSQDTPVLAVTFSPDGKFIATGSGDSRVILWSAKGNQLQAMEGHRAEINSVYFSPDGKTLASASTDKTVRLWQLDGDRLQAFAALWAQDLSQLLPPACERARDFLKNSQRVEEGDRTLCD